MRRPPAAPTAVSGLLRWAEQLVKHLASEMDRSRVDPHPVVLAHREDNSKAVADGTLMYDPLTKRVVVAIDGQWKPLALQP